MNLRSTLDELGGEDALRALVERFYDLIETDPRGEKLKLLHLRGHGIAHSRTEQFDFLSGFLGGPRYYAERHGHMDIRQIHAHVPISQEVAETWLELMDQALTDLGHEGAHVDRMRQTFRRIALMLINDLGDWGMRRGQ
ncbi:group II truncated hemoglobin [Pseudaminobacter sp. 19-2017]|uniref:Group II truncated hemoglobin n=1 Tax=Pseudaminobacter soli (ex Zhang et al. 2022) TaxID=2831468 RepID=A0A942E9Q3_9HYPH|nr:group II truncated hemoglobin [Pseudaminobacter soli]MBS3651042.1 group II truncated hemoglobin [Pseudaminobacter soli]